MSKSTKPSSQRITKIHSPGLLRSAMSYRHKLAEAWRKMPSQCSQCGGLIKAEAFSENRTAWCPHCQKVAELPLLKLKDWITGTVLLLIIKVQAGL